MQLMHSAESSKKYLIPTSSTDPAIMIRLNKLMIQLYARALCLLVCTINMTSCYIQNESGGTSSSDISFESDLAPLLSQNCASVGCHDETTQSGGLNLGLTDTFLAGDVFAQIQPLLDTTTPENSVLLLQATNSDPDDPHTGGEVFSIDSDDYQNLLTWIEEGALNDDCTTVEHSFATHVQPIFTNCNGAGCHDANETLNLSDDVAFVSIEENNAVDVDHPVQSNLLQYGLGNNDHPGGALFATVNDDDFRTIFCWIKVDQAVEN